MIAGTIALLDEPADDDLESDSSGFVTLDVHDAQEYLDGATVQNGRACSLVEGTKEEIHVTEHGTTIEVETVGTRERVWTDWVADVSDAGFVAAERTAGSDPAFPFDLFEAATRTDVSVARIDPAAFVRQREDCSLWFSGSKTETGENQPNDAKMAYGQDASQAGGNVGVGFKTGWNGTTVRGTLYASGYVAVYRDTWGPVQFAAFVRDAILPVASVPEDDEEGEQSTLGAECDRCGREPVGPENGLTDGLCITCVDLVEERGES